MSLRLKLSQMKKVSSDKTHTLMQTPEGHEIRIAHSALSRPHRKALESLPIAESAVKMASGGEVYPVCKNPQCKSFGSSHPNCRCYSLAKGGEVKQGCKCCTKMADGGEVSDNDIIERKAKVDAYNNLHEDEPKEYDQDTEVRMQRTDATPKKYADGTLDASLMNDPEPTPMTPVQLPPPSDLSSIPSNIAADSVTAPQDAPASQPPASVAAPQPAAASPLAQSPDASQPPTIADAYKNQVQGTQDLAKAESAQSDAKAQELKTTVLAQEKLANEQAAADKSTQTELSHIRDDIDKTHIDPNRYMGNMDTLPKIGTAVALVLGGIAGGGKGNQVLDFVNQQIDRDIDSQKANLGKKESLYSALLKQSENQHQATNMARLIMNDMTLAKLQKAEMSTNDPIIKARAQQGIGAIQAQMAPLIRTENFFKLATSAPLQPGQDQTEQMIRGMRFINPEMAKEMESRYVPGVGSATVPIEPKIREELAARQSLHSQIQHLRSWAKDHAGALSPVDTAYGKALANTVQDAYRRANGQGVFREAESKFVQGIVEQDPTKFFNKYRVDPKYKALEDSNASELSSLKRSYGLPDKGAESQLSPQLQSFAKWARENPNDKRSAPLLKKLGLSN